MKTKALARYVLSPLFTASILLTAGYVFAQGERKEITQDRPAVAVAEDRKGVAGDSAEPPEQTFAPLTPATETEEDQAKRGMPQAQGGIQRGRPCPKPFTINMTATVASPYMPDFSTTYPPNGVFNGTQANKRFGHTFKLQSPGTCCECKEGQNRLTVVYKALQSGQSLTSSNAGNDTSGIITNGVGVPGSSVHIWGPTGIVAVGQIKTITYNVPCSVVSTGRVSFQAQDDTAVLSAKLVIRGCCVTPTFR